MEDLKELEREAKTETILTNAKVPIFLDGKEYLAQCPKDRDFTELNEWIRSRYIKLARMSGIGLSRVDRDELLSVAIRTAMRVRWSDDDGLSVINTPEGIAKICYMMISAAVPYENLCEMMNDPDNVNETIRLFDHFNAMAVEAANTTEGNGKAEKN